VGSTRHRLTTMRRGTRGLTAGGKECYNVRRCQDGVLDAAVLCELIDGEETDVFNVRWPA